VSGGRQTVQPAGRRRLDGGAKAHRAAHVASPAEQRPNPVDSDRHLNHERSEASVDGDDARRCKVDAGLHDSSTQQPRRQRIRRPGTASRERNQEQAPEQRQAFDAVRVRPGEPLHERRDVGVVGLELVRPSTARENQMAAQDLHDDEQQQRPTDEQREYQG